VWAEIDAINGTGTRATLDRDAGRPRGYYASFFATLLLLFLKGSEMDMRNVKFRMRPRMTAFVRSKC
jgi:hypothetical protein